MSFVSHQSLTEKEEKSWLTHIPLFFFRGKSMFLHTACLNSDRHLHSKYLMREWRMAHFVGCQQWVFSNIQAKEHKVNTQVKWRWISKRWRSAMMLATLWYKWISYTLLWSVTHNNMIFYIKEYRLYTKPPTLRINEKVFYTLKQTCRGFRKTDSCIFSKWSPHLLCSTRRRSK